jgi:hypothetical protein
MFLNKLMGLQRKILVEFSLPLIISLLIIILSAYLPFILSYSALIDEFIHDIGEERRDVFYSIGSFTSDASTIMIQSTINLVLIADDTLRKYENETLSLNPSFNYKSVPINGKLLETYKVWPKKWNPKLKVSREPEWYLHPNKTTISYLPSETTDNLKRGAILDTVLGTLIPNPLIPGYYVGFSDDLSYLGPTKYRNIFKNDNVGLIKNCTQRYIMATCMPWYRSISDEVKVKDTVKVGITRPFYYKTSGTIVQEVCIGTYKDNKKTGVICNAFEFEKAYNAYMRSFGDSATRYIVDKSGYIIYHPLLKKYTETSKQFNPYDSLEIPITNLEFNDKLDSDNAEMYEDTIIPLFGIDSINQTVYKNIDNTNTLLDMYPIHLRLAINAVKEHTYNLGITASYYSLEAGLQDSKSEIGYLILIQGILAYFVIFSLSIFIYFASLRLYSWIVKPLNDLSSLICQMHRDLNISFTNYENSNSYEISLLFTVFERLKVIMRLRKSKYFNNSKDSVTNYTLGYRIFKQVNNIKGMFYSTYHLGCLAYLRKDYRSGVLFFTTSLQLSDMLTIEPYLLLRIRKGLILCYYQLDDMNSFMTLVQSSLERIEANLNSENWDEWADTILLQCDYMLSKGFPVQNLLDVIKPKDFNPNPIIIQKLYYMQAVCFKGEGRYRDAMKMLYKALVRVM